MLDGYIRRQMDLQDLLAQFVSPICNSGGHGKVTPEQLLGRPPRGQVKHLADRKVDERLAEKDRERRERLKTGKPQRGKKAG